MDQTSGGAGGPPDRIGRAGGPPDRIPGDAPPGRSSRRLDRAPSDRYGPDPGASGAAAAALPGGSVTRVLLFAIPAAVFALAAYVAIAGPFAISEGLVIVGILAGSLFGRSVRAGAGTAVDSRRRVRIALTITGAWFVLAQVGTWQFALSEGGVLPILDYLAQTFGLVVPLVAIAATVAAWWNAR
jgi:hypothetical protein